MKKDKEKTKLKISLIKESTYKPEYAQQLIEFMKCGFSFYAFGGKIGVTRRCLEKWTEAYPDFRLARDIGELYSLKFWETLAIKALSGCDEKFSKLFNSAVWIYNMKCRFPEEWTDRVLSHETKEYVITFSDGTLVKSPLSDIKSFYSKLVDEGRKRLPDIEVKDVVEFEIDNSDDVPLYKQAAKVGLFK